MRQGHACASPWRPRRRPASSGCPSQRSASGRYLGRLKSGQAPNPFFCGPTTLSKDCLFYYGAAFARGSDRSMQVMIRNMTQLVRIAGDINCNDLVVFDLQRGGLQRIVLLDGDETWQAIDEAIAHEPRHVLGKDRRQRGMDLHDVVEPDSRLRGRPCLAATIGISVDIRREQRSQLLHVATAGSREERSGDLKAALPGHLKAWPRGANVTSRAAGKLPACRGLAIYGLGDFLEAHAEHVVKKKGS